ncbi:MAG: hypothetical protein AAF517_03350 [Planctomycetota bacterium]
MKRTILLAAATVVASCAQPARADVASLLKTPAGRTVSYSGSARLRQVSGKQVLADAKFTTRALLLADKPKGKKQSLRLARSTQSSAGTTAVLESISLTKSADGKSSLYVEEVSQELDEANRDVSIYFPFSLESDIAAPKGTETTQDATIRALSQIRVPTQVTSRRRESGDLVSVEHELASSANATFSFNRQTATLKTWKTVHSYSRSKGRLEEFSYQSTIVLGSGDSAIRIEIESSAKAGEESERTGAAKYRFDEALTSFAALEKAVAAREPSSHLTKHAARITSFLGETNDRALADAATSWAAYYKKTFESNNAGRILAKLLDRQPPDFTLEDLDGKKVNLREAIKGKVAYLNFWGVG